MTGPILAIETATGVCSAAATDGTTVFERSLSGGRLHDAQLLAFIDAVMTQAALHRRDLAAVAVSAGPGSYTGLRIGVSVAKAIADALGIALIAVPSLESAAAAADSKATVTLAAFPSRRREVFGAAYRRETVGLRPRSLVGTTMAGNPEDLLEELERLGATPGEVVGPGAEAFAASAVPFRTTACSAAVAIPIAQRMLADGDTVDPEGFEPYYLKEFVAGIAKRSVFARLPF